MKRLPNKPSALIKVALADLYLAEKNSRFKIDMNTWHDPDSNARCCVCLAGVIMATSEESKGGTVDLVPSSFPPEIADKLRALEEFRTGDVEAGLFLMNLELPEGMNAHRSIMGYRGDPLRFKKHMRQLAYDLEKKGL